MDVIFQKSESRKEKWDETFWFSSSLGSKEKQFVLAFYGESKCFGGCGISHQDSMNFYCFEYITYGKATLIDEDNTRFPLTPGTLYVLTPDRRCRITVPANQELHKIIIGVTNGSLLQLMLYRSQITTGDPIKLPMDSKAIAQLNKIGEMVKNGQLSDDELSAECYLFLRYLDVDQEANSLNSMQTLCKYMQNHLQSNISLEELSQTAGMSKVTLIRKFREQFSTTPIQYLIHLRLDYARTLLKLRNISVNEAATLCGYHNVKFFSREYHRYFGFPPSQRE